MEQHTKAMHGDVDPQMVARAPRNDGKDLREDGEWHEVAGHRGAYPTISRSSRSATPDSSLSYVFAGQSSAIGVAGPYGATAGALKSSTFIGCRASP